MNTANITNNTSCHLHSSHRQYQYFAIVFVSSVFIIGFYSFMSGLNLADTLLHLHKFLYPIVACILIIVVFQLIDKILSRTSRSPNTTSVKYLAYALFFSISVTSFFGITKTLTGAYAGSTNELVFGLSFYTAFLAYKIFTSSLSWRDTLIASNPLLLITGPIATIFHHTSKHSLQRRFTKYFPFLVIGIFFFKIIATPLAHFLPLIALTNFRYALLFAFIFELFVYFNFAGLSLIIYALFGFFGIKVPLNFQQPFSSRNLVDFWKGWHVSLSLVLKTLFYTPIRKKTWRGAAPLAVFAVFLSSALWHGVTINFVMWGMLHSLCFIATVFLLRCGYARLTTVLMIFAIVIGRMIFADSDIGRLLLKLSFTNAASHANLASISKFSYISLFIATALVFVEFVFAHTKYFKQRTYKFLRLPVMQVILLISIAVLISVYTGGGYAVYGQR